MSTVSSGARAAVVVALAAALSTTFAGSAQAEPSPSPSQSSAATTKADADVTATYSISSDSAVVDDTVLLQEGVLNPPDADVTRRIDWGDGSPIQVETKAKPFWAHIYKKVGVYHLSVELQSGTATSAGTFPQGNTITIIASVPPDVLSATYHLVPDHVRVKEPVTLAESNVHGDQTPPVFLLRYINWGDGTPEEEFSGGIIPKPHKYAKAGTYHVSVRLVNLQWHTAGTFPDGNTVTVTGAPSSGNGTPGSGTGGSAGGTGDNEGGLPVTGPGATAIGGAGVALLVAGALTFVAFRRRRIRFVR